MQKLPMISVVALVLVCAASAFAHGPAKDLVPELGEPQVVLQAPSQPAPPAEPAPGAMMPLPEGAVSGPSMVAPQSGELFSNVDYRWVRKIAPCAIPMVVSVKDPCASKDPCCPVTCVNVEICVPQCPTPPKVTTNKSGCKTCYDFGKYRVELVSRRGTVVVNYHN